MTRDNATQGLRSVLVSKHELLKKLKENKAQHEADYKEARAGYEEAVVMELASALAKAKAKTEFKTYLNLTVGPLFGPFRVRTIPGWHFIARDAGI